MSITPMDWRHRGACAGQWDLFFGRDDESTATRQVREAAAKLVCRDCPVKRLCGRHAVTTPERWGTWGGIGEAERVHARRNYLRRQRGYSAA